MNSLVEALDTSGPTWMFIKIPVEEAHRNCNRTLQREKQMVSHSTPFIDKGDNEHTCRPDE